MYKLYGYWSAPKPEDVEAFETYYLETHFPRAAAVPNLLQISMMRSEGFEGGTPLNYRVAEMVFASKAAMEQSAKSAEWAVMRQCSADIIARFGVTLQVDMGEVTTREIRR